MDLGPFNENLGCPLNPFNILIANPGKLYEFLLNFSLFIGCLLDHIINIIKLLVVVRRQLFTNVPQ